MTRVSHCPSNETADSTPSVKKERFNLTRGSLAHSQIALSRNSMVEGMVETAIHSRKPGSRVTREDAGTRTPALHHIPGGPFAEPTLPLTPLDSSH